MTGWVLKLEGVRKEFVNHLHGGLRLPVVEEVSFTVAPGRCLVLTGRSGAGKSSILRMIYGNYGCDAGRILFNRSGELIDIGPAAPREMIELRRTSIGYVSQFLRVIPRVSALDVVIQPLLETGADAEVSIEKAKRLLSRLHVPQRLWGLPPATFSGGEQQRINIAHGFIAERPLLLLDEPTASLDAANRSEVVALINEKKAAGVAVVAIVHDEAVRDAIADVAVDVDRFSLTAEEAVHAAH
jgi:alpha-D-ribose 1-methylphosphonate 5-triphosphate synthase subunit PhnL